MKLISKIGVVKCSKRVLYDREDIVKLFFSNFFPYSIEFDFHDNVVFHCFSEYFEDVKDGDEIPSYEVFINDRGNGEIFIDKVAKLKKDL